MSNLENKPFNMPVKVRHQAIGPGDQLDENASALQDFDPAQDGQAAHCVTPEWLGLPLH